MCVNDTLWHTLQSSRKSLVTDRGEYYSYARINSIAHNSLRLEWALVQWGCVNPRGRLFQWGSEDPCFSEAQFFQWGSDGLASHIVLPATAYKLNLRILKWFLCLDGYPWCCKSQVWLRLASCHWQLTHGGIFYFFGMCLWKPTQTILILGLEVQYFALAINRWRGGW